MPIRLPERQDVLSPLRAADILASGSNQDSPTVWWVRVLKAISENKLACNGPDTGVETITADCGFSAQLDLHIRVGDLGTWLSRQGYSVVYGGADASPRPPRGEAGGGHGLLPGA